MRSFVESILELVRVGSAAVLGPAEGGRLRLAAMQRTLSRELSIELYCSSLARPATSEEVRRIDV